MVPAAETETEMVPNGNGAAEMVPGLFSTEMVPGLFSGA